MIYLFLQKSILQAPYICFRVVTRGDSSHLVHNNVQRNVNTCLNVGLKKFIVEVVADKSISLASSKYIREVVVPTSYQTRTGALFKARALQYCLEDGVKCSHHSNKYNKSFNIYVVFF